MFYDSRLMKSKTIGSLWRSAHKISESKKKAEAPFDQTCTQLSQWMQQCEDETVPRLSLRTSSTLVSGAASLYKRKLEELLADLQNTEESMRSAKFSRRQSCQNPDDQAEESVSSGSKTLPNKSTGDHSSSSLGSLRPPKHPTTLPTLEGEELDPEEAEELEISPEDHDDESPGFPPENGDRDTSETVNSYSQRSSTVKCKNANTQTSLKDLSTEEVDEDSETGKAEPQPFVCAIVYESKKTAVPNKLLHSSVNPNVLNLLPS